MILVSLKSKSGPVVTNAVKNFIYQIMGPPDLIHTDRDGCFKDNLFGTLCSNHGTEHQATSRFFPQSNALVERYVAHIKERIRIYIKSTGDPNWDGPAGSLYTFAMAHNATPLSLSTASKTICPEEIQFGFKTLKPHTLLEFTHLPNDPQKFYKVIAENAKKLHQYILQKRCDTKMQRMQWANKSRKERTFSVGDIVFAQTVPIMKAGTLNARYDGPWKVLDAGKSTCLLEHTSEHRKKRLAKVHFDHIAHCKEFLSTKSSHPFVPKEFKNLLQ
jgi:ribosomal protein L21E